MPPLSSLRPIIPALILALACTLGIPAAAKDASAKAERARPVRTVVPDESEPPGAWTAGTVPEAECTRARRKLWQAGEGWIVKTITTCH